MILRVNLGPLYILDEGLFNEVFEFDKGKSYSRKESRIYQLISNDLNTSADVSTFEKYCEEKSHFPTHFWLPDKDIKVKLYLMSKIIQCCFCNSMNRPLWNNGKLQIFLRRSSRIFGINSGIVSILSRNMGACSFTSFIESLH